MVTSEPFPGFNAQQAAIRAAYFASANNDIAATRISPATQTLPGSNVNLAQASLTDLQNAYNSISSNASNYDSNRGQFQPSTNEISTALEQARQNVVSPIPVIPTLRVETPPQQVRRDYSPPTNDFITSIIPAPVIPPVPVQTPPPQVNRGTITNPVISTPSTPSSLPKIAVIAVVVFGVGLLFLSPKASKRR